MVPIVKTNTVSYTHLDVYKRQVYRSKFVPTVFAARQFVNHGHVTVNGKKVNIPSYRVKVGDVVEVKQKSRSMALVLEALESVSYTHLDVYKRQVFVAGRIIWPPNVSQMK